MIHNNTSNITSTKGRNIVSEWLVNNNLPITADCIIDELNDPVCNIGLFKASDINVVRMYPDNLVFIDPNGNCFSIRQNYGELMGWKKYMTDEKFGYQCMRVRTEAIEKSGGEAAVFEIGLNIASVVEFGTNGVSDEVAQSQREIEELEKELNEKFGNGE